MKFLQASKDGGDESHVWAYWLIEIKSLFSIALLCFENGTRDAFHSHAFNSVSWLLWGRLGERMRETSELTHFHYPSTKPIITRRDTFHQVCSGGRSWVLTFRGPWKDTWQEQLPERGPITLTHGRQEIPANRSAA